MLCFDEPGMAPLTDFEAYFEMQYPVSECDNPPWLGRSQNYANERRSCVNLTTRNYGACLGDTMV
jgi:hypothetical protein